MIKLIKKHPLKVEDIEPLKENKKDRTFASWHYSQEEKRELGKT